MHRDKSQPRVSIVTCFLNLEKYLHDCIVSVLAQTFTNWELILIDDGSTDKSRDIAFEFSKKYPDKIIYLEHEGHANKGPSVSRNYGIQQARGEWIAFLDGDDLWLPDYLATQLNLVDQHPTATVFFEATLYWRSYLDHNAKDVIIPVGVPANKLYPPMTLIRALYPFTKAAAPCICGMLVKREVLLGNGGFNESFRGLYGDQIMLCKLYLHQTIYVSSNCNNWYRQRPDSLVYTYQYNEGYYAARTSYLFWLKDYLLKENINDLKINRRLKKLLFQFDHPHIFKIFVAWPYKIKFLIMRWLEP